jgi:hypothetical protein
MDKVELERRTKEFAVRIMQFVTSLPKNKAAACWDTPETRESEIRDQEKHF